MEILINTHFPYASESKQEDVSFLEKEMKAYFADKNYTERVESYLIAILCDGYMKARKRSRYYDDVYINDPFIRGKKFHLYRSFEMDVELDFNRFFASNRQGGYNIIARALLKELEEMKYPLKIRKVFDKGRFNHDMRNFFVDVMHCNLEEEEMPVLTEEESKKLREPLLNQSFFNNQDGKGVMALVEKTLKGLANIPKENVKGKNQLDKINNMIESVLKGNSENSEKS